MSRFLSSKSGHSIQYCVFDILYYEGKSVMLKPLIERKELLERILPCNELFVYVQHFEGQGEALYELTKTQSLEGIVLKKADSFYNMLGALDSDLKKPFMQLSTALAYNTNAFLLETNSQETYFVIIDNVTHGDFSDALFAFTNEASRGTRDAMEQRNIITSYTKAFFDKYMLKKETEIEALVLTVLK
ncbi:hypothetical protein CHH64_17000 [Terribacillus saccharophilus]|uniref:ATP-dependent DNA ligase family profile domain-containing protein n=2 Tax=Terribacillus saccharophilus TaxID=361277 RepID=A0A268A701_9BACI|nr:hypothetical protein CHH64_17000 [Terribacillus saccharophilus]